MSKIRLQMPTRFPGATLTLALLAAALQPRRLTWEKRSTLLGSSERYVEQIDFGPAWQAWESRAAQLEAASLGDPGATENPKLARLQRAFWADDAAAWRKLAAESRGNYQAKLTSTGPERQWEAAAGAARLGTAFDLVCGARLIWCCLSGGPKVQVCEMESAATSLKYPFCTKPARFKPQSRIVLQVATS